MRRRPLPPVREETHQKPWKTLCDNDWVVYTLVASVGALTYANSLHGEFVHDDIPAIVSNSDVNGRNGLSKVFVNDFWGTPMSDANSHKSYRPLTTLSFRLNYKLCGLSPWWWHAVNVCLHAACCALVARTGAAVARLRRPFAALAALLFAVHPIHTEAVAGVVGRADVLACIFFLSSILLYHGSSGRHRVWASILMAALSMLAKETGLTALLFNIAFDVYRCWTPVARSSTAVKWRWKSDSVCGRVLVAATALLLLAGVRLALLQGSLPAFSPQDNPPAFHPSIAVRVMTFCYLAAFNWWLLLCPWSLSHDWQMGSVPLITCVTDGRNLLTCAGLVVLLALAYRTLLDLESQKPPAAAAGLLLLVLPYLPASNLLVTVGFVIAERVLYIPSVGSVLLTVYGVQLVWRGRRGRAAAAGVLVLAAAGAARTALRNTHWATRETLLRADLAVLPHNAKLHYNFANFLKDIDQNEDAIKHYKEALTLWPSYASAHNNLGTLVAGSAAGRAAAEHHFLQALAYNRQHVNAHYNLANLYRKKNRHSDALKMLERCLSLEPRFVQAYLELLHLTPADDQRWILDKLLELEPDNWEHYVRYGHWMRDRGLMGASVQWYGAAWARARTRSERGAAVAVRAACLALRALGQHARIQQMLNRWHCMRGDGEAVWRRRRAALAWRLRLELAERAAHYARPHIAHAVTSTCLHHSQLEVSQDKYKNEVNQKPPERRTLQIDAHCYKTHCDKRYKKSVSLTSQYKPTHNKSETGHKQKSCPLHKKKKIKDPEAFTPFVSEHLIKTY